MRIISLAPNVTEILFALGLGDSIVGVTDRCNYPSAAARIERVSGFGTPNVETLLSLSPTLVVASGLARPELADVLRQSGARVLDVQPSGFISDFPAMFEAVRQIGAATGRGDEAAKLIATMQGELNAIASRFTHLEEPQRPRVFVEIEDSPLMTSGAGSFIDDLIHRGGGRNVAHEIEGGYPRIDPEKVVAWNPDVIIVAHADRPGEAVERLTKRIGWAEIAAVRNRRIIDDIDADLLFRPGPRLVEGVKALAERLHPSLPTP